MLSEPTAPSYLRSAFLSQYNLILFGGSALFALASASLWPLAAGVAAELLWLGVGSRTAAFRRRIEQRSKAERLARLDDEVMTGMSSLGREHIGRLLAMGQAMDELRSAGDADSGGLTPELSLALFELEQLRPAFLKLCQLHQRLSGLLEEGLQQEPQQELERLSRAYSLEKDLGMRLTLRQGINLAQRQIDQQARLQDIRRTVELKLSLAEQSLAHLRSQRWSLVEPPELARGVKELLAQLATASVLEIEVGSTQPSGAPR